MPLRNYIVLPAVIRRLIWAPRLHRFIFRFFCRWKKVEVPSTILIIRPDHIGDFVLGVPFLRAIRNAYPLAEIHLVTSKQSVPIAKTCPWLSSITTIPSGLEYWGPNGGAGVCRLLRIVKFSWIELRRLDVDWAILPRIDVDGYGASLMMLVSGANRRISFTEKSFPLKQLLNHDFDFYLTDVVTSPIVKHEVESSQLIAEYLGVHENDWTLELWPNTSDITQGKKAIESLLNGRQIAFIGPGAADHKRRWPVEHFSVLAKNLIDLGLNIVVIGSHDDARYATAILENCPKEYCVSIAGVCSLNEVAATMRFGSLYIGNDSGPLHIAAAVGIPCVEISCFPKDGDPSHSNSPKRFGPWTSRFVVLQPSQALSPCSGVCESTDPHCISTVSVQAVTHAACSLLQPV